MAGRPTKYSSEIADIICETIATTDKGLRKIAEENNISTFSILKWLQEYPEFSIQYTHAREMQADYLADQIINIADDNSKDVRYDEDGNELTDHDVIARARLRVDARKWKASKLYPKRYAERTNTDFSSGGEPIADLQISFNLTKKESE